MRVTSSLLAIVAGIGITIAPMTGKAAPVNEPETVFVMTNNADGNEVIAYEQVGGQFIQAHRYDTGGRGSGGTNDPLGSQGSLNLSADHSLLFAANAGSGTISVFRVLHGRLFLADRVPSGGSEPVAVAQHQDLVYVLNAAGSGSVVGFHLDVSGHLQQIKNSTTFLTESGAGGASITISPDGRFLAVTEKVTNNIDIFPIQPDSTLGSIVANPSAGPGAFAARFAPDGKLFVSETGPAGATNAAAISSYSVLPNGGLAVISKSVPTLGAANCWNAVTPDGQDIYVSNAASSTISGFAISKSGSLAPLAGTVVGSNPQGSGNLDITISSDGKFVFTVNSAAGTIGVFAVQQGGTLSNIEEIEGLPKSVGYNGIAAL